MSSTSNGGDHPRSRGVYRQARPRGQRWRGSSPLARGLLPRGAVDGASAGIIPARAGFTHVNGETTDPAPGSSPLARGLPRDIARVLGDRGIIPARAGFTSAPSRSGRAVRDHPRSRGVYPETSLGYSAIEGSSPLARGLPLRHHAREERSGIIPARAGFTPPTPWRMTGSGDHPRSRGVYPETSLGYSAIEGSSPLARGLRDGRPPEGGHGGIIPARAGFTTTWAPRLLYHRDHPRSRGVYLRGVVKTVARTGSSPLARGLRGRPRRRGRLRRIIPARAGFTGGAGNGVWFSEDHPRSRGVYRLRKPSRRGTNGSSPLARGLR